MLYFYSRLSFANINKGKVNMNTLYLVRLPSLKATSRIVGYVILNDVGVKLVEANSMEDIECYMKRRNFKDFEWRIPKMQKFQLIKVKEW
jgi:hypothetical protein